MYFLNTTLCSFHFGLIKNRFTASAVYLFSSLQTIVLLLTAAATTTTATMKISALFAAIFFFFVMTSTSGKVMATPSVEQEKSNNQPSSSFACSASVAILEGMKGKTMGNFQAWWETSAGMVAFSVKYVLDSTNNDCEAAHASVHSIQSWNTKKKHCTALIQAVTDASSYSSPTDYRSVYAVSKVLQGSDFFDLECGLTWNGSAISLDGLDAYLSTKDSFFFRLYSMFLRTFDALMDISGTVAWLFESCDYMASTAMDFYGTINWSNYKVCNALEFVSMADSCARFADNVYGSRVQIANWIAGFANKVYDSCIQTTNWIARFYESSIQTANWISQHDDAEPLRRIMTFVCNSFASLMCVWALILKTPSRYYREVEALVNFYMSCFVAFGIIHFATHIRYEPQHYLHPDNWKQLFPFSALALSAIFAWAQRVGRFRPNNAGNANVPEQPVNANAPAQPVNANVPAQPVNANVPEQPVNASVNDFLVLPNPQDAMNVGGVEDDGY